MRYFGPLNSPTGPFGAPQTAQCQFSTCTTMVARLLKTLGWHLCGIHREMIDEARHADLPIIYVKPIAEPTRVGGDFVWIDTISWYLHPWSPA